MSGPQRARELLSYRYVQRVLAGTTALAVAGIIVAVLSVAWNLASIAVLRAELSAREQAQQAAAAMRAAEAASTQPQGSVVWVGRPEHTSSTIGLMAFALPLFSLHLGVAGILLAASIGLLRRSPKAPSLLLSYVYLKVPLSVLAGPAWYWLLHRDSTLRPFSIPWSLLVVILGCAFPAVVWTVWRGEARSGRR